MNHFKNIQVYFNNIDYKSIILFHSSVVVKHNPIAILIKYINQYLNYFQIRIENKIENKLSQLHFWHETRVSTILIMLFRFMNRLNKNKNEEIELANYKFK